MNKKRNEHWGCLVHKYWCVLCVRKKLHSRKGEASLSLSLFCYLDPISFVRFGFVNILTPSTQQKQKRLREKNNHIKYICIPKASKPFGSNTLSITFSEFLPSLSSSPTPKVITEQLKLQMGRDKERETQQKNRQTNA